MWLQYKTRSSALDRRAWQQIWNVCAYSPNALSCPSNCTSCPSNSFRINIYAFQIQIFKIAFTIGKASLFIWHMSLTRWLKLLCLWKIDEKNSQGKAGKRLKIKEDKCFLVVYVHNWDKASIWPKSASLMRWCQVSISLFTFGLQFPGI